MLTIPACRLLACLVLGGVGLGIANDAFAQFLEPSLACPGAVQLVDGTPADPGRVLDLSIPDGGSATCNALPPAFPFPENAAEAAARFRNISGGNDTTLVNNVRGIVGETPEFEASFAGSGNEIINNGDLTLFVNGGDNAVTNANGFLAGNALGDDFALVNESSGVVLGMTIEGARASVENSGAIAEGFPNPVTRGRGLLVIGPDATVDNLGGGVIAVNGPEGTAVFAAGNRSRIDNGGTIIAEGDETVAAGIDGNGTAAQRVAITNTGSITTDGDESTAVFIEGNFALADNDNEIVANGDEASGIFVEGNDGRIENSGTVEVNGDLSIGLAIVGNDGVIENDGTVAVTGNTAIALGGLGTNIDVGNRGTVTTDGDNAIGIAILGEQAGALNAADRDIVTSGIGSHGMLVGVEDLNAVLNGLLPPSIPSEIQATGSVGNEGTIRTGGDDAHGIAVHMREGSVATFDGSEIETTGSRSHGISATETNGANLSILSLGDITTTGSNSDGIHVERNNTAIRNDGKIKTSELGSSGIDATGNFVLVTNRGEIETGGLGASGISAELTNTSVFSPGSIKTSGISAHGVEIKAGSDNVGVNLGGVIETTGPSADGANVDGNDIRVEIAGGVRPGTVKATGANAAGVRFVSDAGSVNSLDVRQGGTLEGTSSIIGGAGSEIVRIAGILKGSVNLGGGNDWFTFTDTAEINAGLWDGGDGDDTLDFEVAAGETAEPELLGISFERFVKSGAGEMLRQFNLVFDEIEIFDGELTLLEDAEMRSDSLAIESDAALTVNDSASVDAAEAVVSDGSVEIEGGSLMAESLTFKGLIEFFVGENGGAEVDELNFEGAQADAIVEGDFAATDINVTEGSDVMLDISTSIEVLSAEDSQVDVFNDLDVTFLLDVVDSSLDIVAGDLNADDANFEGSELEIDSGAELDVANELFMSAGSIDVFGDLEAATTEISGSSVNVEFEADFDAGNLTMSGGDLDTNGELDAASASFENTDVVVGFDGELEVGTMMIVGGEWEVLGDVDVTTATITEATVFVEEDGSWVTGNTTVGQGASMEVDGSIRGTVLRVSDGEFCANGFVGFVTAIAEDGSRFDPGCSIGDMVLGGDLEFGGSMLFEIGGEDLFDTVTVLGDLLFTGGLFEFDFVDGFVPSFGMSFDLLNVAGDIFDSELLALSIVGADDFGLDFAFGDGGLSIEVIDPTVEVPEPHALLLMTAGWLMLLGARLRTRRQHAATLNGSRHGRLRSD